MLRSWICLVIKLFGFFPKTEEYWPEQVSSFLCRTARKSEPTFLLINAGITASSCEFRDWNCRVLMAYF